MWQTANIKIMIQRIQSIYLLLATAFMATFLFLPFAYIDGNNLQSVSTQGILTSDGNMLHTWGFFTFGAVSALITFITIFLYKNRPLQMRLCRISIIFIVCLYAIIGFLYLAKLAVTPLPTLIIPAVALVLNLLAYRSIKKDERLVRSLDRVR